MPRFKTTDIYVESDCEDRKNRKKLHAKVTVNIDAEGVFTAYLPEDTVKHLTGLGIRLSGNPRRSGGRDGYFSNKTYGGLLKDIKAKMQLAVHRKRISQEVVLRYVMKTRAAFGVTLPDDKGVRKVIPNLGWGYEGPIDMERYWIHTSDQAHVNTASMNFIKFAVRPMYKEIYEFPGGQTVEEYRYIRESSIDHDKAPNLKYLVAIPKMNFGDSWAGRQYTPVEIPYTEEAAAFFVKVFFLPLTSPKKRTKLWQRQESSLTTTNLSL